MVQGGSCAGNAEDTAAPLPLKAFLEGINHTCGINQICGMNQTCGAEVKTIL